MYVIFEKFRTCLELLPIRNAAWAIQLWYRTAKEPREWGGSQSCDCDTWLSSRTGAVIRRVVTESSGKIELTQHANEIGENEVRVLGTENNCAHGVLREPTQSAQCGTAERLASRWETEDFAVFLEVGGVCFIFCLVSSFVLVYPSMLFNTRLRKVWIDSEVNKVFPHIFAHFFLPFVFMFRLIFRCRNLIVVSFRGRWLIQAVHW